jgi:hypothetical protein
MMPMASGTNPTSPGFAAVSGNTPGGTAASYNFTWSPSSNHTDVNMTFPAGFDVTNASVSTTVGHRYNGTEAVSKQDNAYLNISGLSQDTGTQQWMVLTGITVPRDAESSFTISASFFNATAEANGTVSAVAIAISTLSLSISVDEGKTNLGAGATTDYVFDVTDLTQFIAGDSLVITFPAAFDVSDSKIGSTVNVGQKLEYTFTGTEASTFEITVEDVVNPSDTADKTYSSVSALVETTADKTIASGTFSIDIVKVDFIIKKTGSNTKVTEGDDTGDTIKVALTSKPSATVTVDIDTGTQLNVDDESITFTTSNWATEKTIKITAVDDVAVEGTEDVDLTFTSSSDDDTYDELEGTFEVEIEDNDEGIVLVPLDEDGDEDDETVVKEGSLDVDTYQVFLSTKPAKDVIVTIDADEGLSVDDTSLTFTTSKWSTPQIVEVSASRPDDEKFQKTITLSINHDTESADELYDGLAAVLRVSLEDDENAALGLTNAQIKAANALVKLTLTSEGEHILVAWELPDQDDLDDIFDSDGDIEIAGVQVLTSKSPYVISQTFEDGDTEFEQGKWEHQFSDGGSLRTAYLVTMYFDEDVGKWTDDTVPDTTEAGYVGTAIRAEILPWWGWLLIALGAVAIAGGIVVGVMFLQKRQNRDDDDWMDDDSTETPSLTDDASVAAKSTKAPKDRKYDLECPVCDHQFAVQGTKPLNTECPDCGAKGVLN